MARSDDLAWAAGLFEGEGSIVCNLIHNRNNSYRTSVSMSSSDKDVLEKFTEIVERGTVLGPYKSKYPNRKDKYDWAVQNYSDCLFVLGQLYPHLCERRKAKADQFINIAIERWLT